MPRGDGTGPTGQGPIGGRGQGGGRGRGPRLRREVSGRPGAGPGGLCLCPACKLSVAHKAGTPCAEMKCPKCGGILVRG
ncbi:MAG: hypothetical protein K9L69_04360 [Candidatus Omnitrophica bacterium]|nr:hypothetical protein [Candidatus Omnitrophota bacterium]